MVGIMKAESSLRLGFKMQREQDKVACPSFVPSHFKHSALSLSGTECKSPRRKAKAF